VTDLEEVDMPTRDKTKEQLYRQAKRLGIKGRSKMNKGQLKAAVNRRSG
jgi:Rho termination factor, N-terminal domain